MGRVLGGLLIVGVVAAICLLVLPRRQAGAYLPSTSYPQGIKIAPESEAAGLPQGLLHYKNKETRDIEWNENGLPVRITIEREYYQLP